jgi:molybdopterin-biosynthesis enzyme MoeA-like protein
VEAAPRGAHHFVPGFPVMAWPMIAWVLDTQYSGLFDREAHVERALLVYEQAEAVLTPLMESLEASYPGVNVFSLPSVGDEQTRRHIELGVKGDPLVAPAFSEMCASSIAYKRNTGRYSRRCKAGTLLQTEPLFFCENSRAMSKICESGSCVSH